jgi:5-methylcytosine-specific restriction endonuclease McrA
MSKGSGGKQRAKWRARGIRPETFTDPHAAGAYAKVSTAPPWLVRRCRSRHYDARLRAAKYGTRVDPMLMPHVLAAFMVEAKVCVSCPVEMTFEIEQDNTATLDHIVPLKDGGPHAIENLQVMCRKCHRGKAHTESKELLVTSK